MDKANRVLDGTEETESDDEPDENIPLKIVVNVNEITLDVVVVDGRGRPITDLTSADFEIYQDKLPQEAASSVYISDQTAETEASVKHRKEAPNLTPFSLPEATLKEDEVRRIIIFVVDTLSMTFEDQHYTKIALKRFVDRQMQHGDLIAIMRTDYGNGISDRFLSDKRELNAQIDGLRAQLTMADRIYGSQEIALSYAIRVLKDMPGRKIIFLVTTEPTIENPFDNFTMPTEDGGSTLTQNSERPSINNFHLYGARFDRLADEALRSGVVVHLLDPTGLCVPIQNPVCEERLKNKKKFPWNPLPAKTGGIIVTDNNFFLDGIGEVANNMIAGYYLLSYIPPSNTFDHDIYRSVTVKVKRKGAVVHTREGFYSRTLKITDSAVPSANPLQKAIFSPFLHNSLNVNMFAGYIKEPNASHTNKRIMVNNTGRVVVATIDTAISYTIHSWIHLDPKDVTIVDTEDGGARIDLEVLCLASDINGSNPYFYETKYIFTFEPEKKYPDIAFIQQHGLRFSFALSVKNPGAYTVHFAVRDTNSGEVGSARQFVEIPDLKKKGMEMSSIFILTSTDDLYGMRLNIIKKLDQEAFLSTHQDGKTRNPALRTYALGDSLQTLAMLYNADTKAINRSEVEVQPILYKDGKEFLRLDPRTVTLEKGEKADNILLLRRITLGYEIPSGDYVLQLLATDKKYSEKRNEEEGVFTEGLFSKIMRTYLGTDKNYNRKGVASQTLSLTVTENAY